VAPIGTAQERRDLVGEQVVDRGRQAGADEGDFATVAEGVLDGCAELAKVAQALAVNLVEGDEPSAPTLAQDVGELGQLRPETTAGSVSLGDLPVGAKSARERKRRSGATRSAEDRRQRGGAGAVGARG
jgi:hypothetical protein